MRVKGEGLGLGLGLGLGWLGFGGSFGLAAWGVTSNSSRKVLRNLPILKRRSSLRSRTRRSPLSSLTSFRRA